MSSATHRSADSVAGFLAAFSLALSGIALVRQPGLLAPAAVLVALVALRMSEARRRMAGIAVLVGGVAFLVGMSVAVVTNTPLY